MTPRERLLADLASRLPDPGHPLRIGVDGITAAGKSTFAAELTAAVLATGRPAEHLTTDDHHQVAAHRHRDPDRARGYYRDAYDLVTVRSRVLDPLGPSGDRWVLPRSHDLSTDQVLDGPLVEVAPDAVVVVDGCFLCSPVLAAAWDVMVWLEVPFAVAVERGVRRDAASIGSPEDVRGAYRERYHGACRLYLGEVDPRRAASYVVDNADPDAARLLKPQ